MPNVSDFDAAMMQPALSVPAVRHLGGGSIRLNDDARPLRIVGRDAVVYELRTPNGRIQALRALLRPDSRRDAALAQRYTALREDPYLEHLRGPSGPLPRDIHWVEEGIALPGRNLQRVAAPLIAMERVPGRTMAQAADRLCREGQGEPLALLADGWLAAALALSEAGFSHGDLAADNLIVRPDGSIAVIDLDTASWPSGAFGPRPTDGTPGFVHPRGAPDDPGQRDHFPALILWASLRILARHPALRERWGDHPDRFGATLLWSHDDLRRPERSPLFAALDALDDATIRPLLEVVRRAIRFSTDDTPPLAEIAVRLEGLGVSRLASTPGKPGRRGGPVLPVDAARATAAPAPDSSAAVRQVWGEDESAAYTPNAARSSWHPDASQTTTLAERERRLAAGRRLGAAVAARNTDLARQLWSESRAIPEAAAHAAAVHHLVSHDVTGVIDRAIRRNDDAGLVAAIEAAELAGVAPSTEARMAVRAARERIASRSALRVAVEASDYPTLAGLKRSGRLDALGPLEPAQTRAVVRSLAWPALERALASDDDVAIAAAADPALWHETRALPTESWARLVLARQRLRWMDDVRAALRRRDGAALRDLLAHAPSGAEQRLTEVEGRRILRVTMREAAVARLERALRDGPDREVVAALAEFESAGAPFSDVLDWTAVRGVVDRLTLADALREAATADPPDTAKLARLLPAARAALGGSGAGEGPDWPELERSVLRAAHLARLREIIAEDDDGHIASAADPDPYGTNALLTPDEQARVRRALQRRAGQRRGAD